MKKKEISDEIFVVEDFLSLEECDVHLSRFQNQAFEEAKVNINGGQVMFKEIRNNDRFLFFDFQLAETLWDRINQFIPSQLGLYRAKGLNEMFRVYKYSKGQRFKMHMDGSYQRNENEESFYSFLIYLNDDYEGGETAFRKEGIVKPKMGNALVFRHHNRHEGKAIISGIKYVLRTDIMYGIME